MDILLTHGYYLYQDPHELPVMKPYPTLGILYISAYLKSRGFDGQVFDSTFSSPEEKQAYLERERPPVVGVYANLMTRPRVIKTIQAAKAAGATVVVGGPEPAHCPAEYRPRGADGGVVG